MPGTMHQITGCQRQAVYAMHQNCR
jgi:hypothetical protein